MPNEPLIEAGLQAVMEIKKEMLIAAGKGFERHGDDPHNAAIMATAIVLMVRDIDANIIPGFTDAMKRMFHSL